MLASKGGDLPKDLLRGRSRFQEAWRQHRRTRGRIPDTLWALAVRLVKRHGLNPTATGTRRRLLQLEEAGRGRRCQRTVIGPSCFRRAVRAGRDRRKQCLFEPNNAAGPPGARATAWLRHRRRRALDRRLEPRVMLQITPQMKILVAVEPADFRRGIDGLGAAVPGETPARSVHRHGVRLSQS